MSLFPKDTKSENRRIAPSDLALSFKAQNAEDDDGCKNGSGAVRDGDADGVSVTVILKRMASNFYMIRYQLF